MAGLGQITDDTRKVDLGRRLLGAVAAERELHDHQLVARCSGDDDRRAIGILGKRMRRLPTRIKLEHRRLQCQTVVGGAARLERDAVVGRRWGVAHLRHHDIDEGRIADIFGTRGRRVVERDDERNLLTDQRRCRVAHRGRGHGRERQPFLKLLRQQLAHPPPPLQPGRSAPRARTLSPRHQRLHSQPRHSPTPRSRKQPLWNLPPGFVACKKWAVRETCRGRNGCNAHILRIGPPLPIFREESVVPVLERIPGRCGDDSILGKREARGSANARGALGGSSPGENLQDREAATFAAREPVIRGGWVRDGGLQTSFFW